MELILCVLGSSALAALISGLFNLASTKQKKESGLEAGVRILLYDRIKHVCLKYIERGYVTHDEYEDLIKMHDVYHTSLKGNGFLDGEMHRVEQLPRR